MGFFEDYRGDASFGRLAAAYCVVGAFEIFQVPFFMPNMATYCANVGGSLLLAAGSFYLTSKGEQGMSSFAQAKMDGNVTKIKALLGIKDADAPTPAPAPVPEAPTPDPQQ